MIAEFACWRLNQKQCGSNADSKRSAEKRDFVSTSVWSTTIPYDRSVVLSSTKNRHLVTLIVVGMFDCCLQGIQPCKWKGNGHQWLGNQVLNWLGLTKEWDLWKRSPKTFWGIQNRKFPADDKILSHHLEISMSGYSHTPSWRSIWSLECPQKSNLLVVCLLICSFSVFFVLTDLLLVLCYKPLSPISQICLLDCFDPAKFWGQRRPATTHHISASAGHHHLTLSCCHHSCHCNGNAASLLSPPPPTTARPRCHCRHDTAVITALPLLLCRLRRLHRRTFLSRQTKKRLS